MFTVEQISQIPEILMSGDQILLELWLKWFILLEGIM